MRHAPGPQVVGTDPDVLIRPANPDEASLLRSIQLLSKAWDYSDETIDRFAAVISMSPEYVLHADVWVIETADSVVGWYSLVQRDNAWELHNMWVIPFRIGHGLGRQLYEHALLRAQHLGAMRVEWEAEPHAVGFYEHIGAKHLRVATSVLGNPISWMGVDLVLTRREGGMTKELAVPAHLAAALADADAAIFEYEQARGRFRSVAATFTEPLAVEVWVLDPSLHQTLLVGHRWRGWVPPGGAAEPGEPPRVAAARELLEETGITAQLLPRPAAVTVRSYLR
jgi:GNAT superfamily N-acetyltransferase